MKRESKCTLPIKLNTKEGNNGGSDIRHRKQIAKQQKSFFVSNYIKCKWIELCN